MSWHDNSTAFLEVTDFMTEAGLDILTINGKPFSGYSGDGIFDVQGAAILRQVTWKTDSSQAFSGWRLCARSSPPEEGTWMSIGPCQVSVDDHACIQSSNFPAPYGNSERCSMRVAGSGAHFLEVVAFETELTWDYINFHGQHFSGTADKVLPLQGKELDGTISWNSDAGVAGHGWKLCARDTAPTSTVTMTTTGMPGSWIVEGPCQGDPNDTKCVTSPNYPENYGNNQQCSMYIAGGREMYLVDTGFETEAGYDFLTVDGHIFSGSYKEVRALHGFKMHEGMKWQSDSSGSAPGWRICAREDPLPTTTYTTTSALPGAWVVVGPCEVSLNDTACVTSSGWAKGAPYGNDEQCVMSIYEGVPKFLEVLYFAVEEGHDFLTINGQQFSGHASEALWKIHTIDGQIMWATDGSQGGDGWKLCARDVAPTSTTTTTTYAPRHSWKELGPAPTQPY